MVCGGMRGRGLTRLHILPSGQTLTSEYYIKEILEKEVKPLTSRRQVTGGPTERMFFRSKKAMTFVHYGAPPQTLKGGSDAVSQQFAKFCTQGWLAGKLTWSKPWGEHLEHNWWDNVQREIQPRKHWTSQESDFTSPGKMWLKTRLRSSRILCPAG